MQLSIFGVIRGIFSPHSKDREKEITKIQGEDHAYIRGSITDRGPCPGLNSLANQGYLPRDGKNITLPRVEAALMTTLHMDRVLAHTLAIQLKPLCRADGTFDLVDMRRHNVIERDVSFSRLDFRHGDNYTFQPAMFDAMLKDTEPEGLTTVDTLAKTYRRRTQEEKESGAAQLPINLYFVSLVQTVSFLHTAEVGGRMKREVLEEFFREERFPEVVTQNKQTRRLMGLIGMTLRLAVKLWFGGKK
ncbi:Chloroperoxidase [Apodospora peruviana]|uniref:Chloroperoxidase n=1 Tax=Apodospora peruviana TaxID=516989 RepID=A0AAE0M7U2_9PEZI|nr:Chloroperoxidase [Apodospora peruviana]